MTTSYACMGNGKFARTRHYPSLNPLTSENADSGKARNLLVELLAASVEAEFPCCACGRQNTWEQYDAGLPCAACYDEARAS